jgi:hypothetical protein
MLRRLRQWQKRRSAQRKARLLWYCGKPLTPEEVELYGKASRLH